MKRKPTPEETGEREHIPSWLPNADMHAPCPCGQPLEDGMPYIVASGETGLTRWFHAWCWQARTDKEDDEG